MVFDLPALSCTGHCSQNLVAHWDPADQNQHTSGPDIASKHTMARGKLKLTFSRLPGDQELATAEDIIATAAQHSSSGLTHE